MILTDNNLFIHIPKTGGTTIRNYMSRHLNNKSLSVPKGVRCWWHRPIKDFPKSHKNITSFAVVRNPWDYYVSVFEYNKKFNHWTPFIGKCNDFNEFVFRLLVDDKDVPSSIDYNAFDSYVYTDHHKYQPRLGDLQRTCHHIYLPRDQTIRNCKIGLLTFRYILMCFKSNKEIFKNIDKLAIDKLSVDKIIKLENLDRELKIILNSPVKNIRRENASTRDKYRKYYSDEIKQLVLERDDFIINTYKYSY